MVRLRLKKIYFLGGLLIVVLLFIQCSNVKTSIDIIDDEMSEAFDGKVMDGFPASAESQVTLFNFSEQPYNKWSFRNAGVLPTLMVPRGRDVYHFKKDEYTKIEDYYVPGHKGKKVIDILIEDDTDGIIVIKDGVIKYEKYFGDFRENNLHIWASSTKSLVSMIAGILVEEGKLELDKTVKEYLPEMENSGFADLTLQQILNMVSALDFSEDYVDLKPGTVQYEYFRRVGLTPAFDLMQLDPIASEVARGNLAFVSQIQQHKKKNVGEVFEYHSPNVDVLGLVMSRVTNKSLEELISEYIWQNIGAEHDAQIITDAAFNPIATGGFMSTLRDFAKFGYTVLNDGNFNEQQLIPKDYFNDTYRLSVEEYQAGQYSKYRKNVQSATFDKHLSGYKNFWWIHDSKNQIMSARGVFGQSIYIDKRKNVVIATFGSASTASNATRETFKAKMDAMKLISKTI